MKQQHNGKDHITCFHVFNNIKVTNLYRQRADWWLPAVTMMRQVKRTTKGQYSRVLLSNRSIFTPWWWRRCCTILHMSSACINHILISEVPWPGHALLLAATELSSQVKPEFFTSLWTKISTWVSMKQHQSSLNKENQFKYRCKLGP